LYQRAIALGGGGFYPNLNRIPAEISPLPSLRDAEKSGEEFLKALGVSELKSGRRLSADAILNAPNFAPAGFRPNIDGTLVVGSNVDLFQQGKFNDTPMLVGFTSDESGSTPPKILVDWMDSVIARSGCKEAQAAIAKTYPRTNDAETSMLRYLFRDFYVGWPAWTWARLQSTKGRNHAFVYIFDVHDPGQPFGASHAAEYPFVFGNFPKTPTPRDEAVSALMRQYWINFSARGDPNGPGLPVWKAFDKNSQTAMVFGDSSESRQLPNIKGLKAVDALLRCDRRTAR
jgi:para-nitrobenzyl esterase